MPIATNGCSDQRSHARTTAAACSRVRLLVQQRDRAVRAPAFEQVVARTQAARQLRRDLAEHVGSVFAASRKSSCAIASRRTSVSATTVVDDALPVSSAVSPIHAPRSSRATCCDCSPLPQQHAHRARRNKVEAPRRLALPHDRLARLEPLDRHAVAQAFDQPQPPRRHVANSFDPLNHVDVSTAQAHRDDGSIRLLESNICAICSRLCVNPVTAGR